MKKVFRLILVLLALMLAVLLGRTLLFSSLQVVAHDTPLPAVDADRLAEQLAGAIRFRTVSHTEAGQDDAVAFRGLQEYLREQFPQVHNRLKREVINNHHLIYTWQGSDAKLAPALLLAHMDVVPALHDKWQQPPFAGSIADGFVWGRGAIDNKASVIGLLAAAEQLLTQGYTPRRTLYFAFGADEEVGGTRGAAVIAALLKQRAVMPAFILDEGGAVTEGIVRDVTPPVALVGIAEKGYLSLDLTVEAKGGHSSLPPPRTAIGILAAAITRLENNPLPLRIEQPVAQMFRYLGPEMPFMRRMVLANQWLFGAIILDRMSQLPSNNAAVRTTTAVTMIDGGIKDNVLPRRAHAVVNFRLLRGDTTESVIARVKNIINDERVVVSAQGIRQEPSAVADVAAGAFRLLQHTAARVYPQALFAPYQVSGATDSRHYAGLSGNIYRFLPVRMDGADLKRLHGVDERVAVQDFARVVQFYAAFMQKL